MTPARKSKLTSVLLAVFLSYWTWLYTYKRDHVKFWWGFGVGIVLLVVAVLLILSIAVVQTSGQTAAMVAFSAVWMFLFWLIGTLGLWIWALVDTTRKKKGWYDSY